MPTRLLVRTCALLVAISWLVLPERGFAADGGGEEGDDDQFGGAVAAEGSLEKLDADYYAAIRGKLALWADVPALGCEPGTLESCRTKLSLGVQLPLRLRVVDRGRTQSELVRRSDWDEVDDYLRTIQHLEYGRDGETFHARVGELGPVDLGHGTIVNDYFNVVTTDHYELGFDAEFDRGVVGGRAIVDHVAGPGVVGGRAWMHPIELFAPKRSEGRLEIGASLVGDLRAPTRLEHGDDGETAVGPARRPRVEERQTTGILGLDVEYAVLQRDRAEFAPFVDYNEHLDLGRGLHAGLRASGRPGGAFRLFGRFEFRLLDEQYLPDYFGPLYEIQRFQLGGWGPALPVPKLKVAASRNRDRTLGGYGEVGVGVEDKLELSGAYADYQGANNASVRFRLR
ncbi:MAG: hypothetical protein ABEL76_14975, partial [Bradymonadaceae bacterium]